MRDRMRKNLSKSSTDGVYGSIQSERCSETSLPPRNLYCTSQAGADRLAYSYSQMYNLSVIVTRTSNDFGSFQYPGELIPLFVTNALENQPLPLNGDGKTSGINSMWKTTAIRFGFS